MLTDISAYALRATSIGELPILGVPSSLTLHKATVTPGDSIPLTVLP